MVVMMIVIMMMLDAYADDDDAADDAHDDCEGSQSLHLQTKKPPPKVLAVSTQRSTGTLQHYSFAAVSGKRESRRLPQRDGRAWRRKVKVATFAAEVGDRPKTKKKLNFERSLYGKLRRRDSRPETRVENI